MLNIIIIALILIGLTVHRYLSFFWEQGLLSYPMGFVSFANLFAIIYLVSLIWMFGAVAGIIISILCYFQAVYSAGLWIFGLPWLLNIHRNLTLPKVNPSVYGGFSFLVIVLGVLTIANFFVSRYESILKLLEYNYWTSALAFLGALIVGNIARVAIMSKLMKK